MNEYKVGDIVSRHEAINILENGGKIQKHNLIYQLNIEGKLSYYNPNEVIKEICVSSGYEDNFDENNTYIIYELSSKDKNFNNTIKSLSDYTDNELLEELKSRLAK